MVQMKKDEKGGSSGTLLLGLSCDDYEMPIADALLLLMFLFVSFFSLTI